MHTISILLTLGTIYTKYDSQYSNKQYPCTPIIYHLYYRQHKNQYKVPWFVAVCLFVWCTFVIQTGCMASVPSLSAVCMTRYSMVLVAQLTHFRSVTLAFGLFFSFLLFRCACMCVCVCVCGESIINKDIPCFYCCKCHRQSAKTFAKMYTRTHKSNESIDRRSDALT